MYNLRVIMPIQAIESVNNNLHKDNIPQHKSNNSKINYSSKSLTFDEILKKHIQNINKN